jgi:alpha/beta superfamily hydrolase
MTPDLRDGGSPTSGARLIEGAVGTIELLIDTPPGCVRGLAVVTHPQPLLGGHARHKVPEILAKALCEDGWLVARPNFRGTGRSAGTHDQGVGETDDVLVCCELLRSLHVGRPLVLVGFSFGAYVQARVNRELSLQGRAAAAVCLLGLPHGEAGGRRYDTPQGLHQALVVHGERDERVPLASVLEWARPHAQPIVVVPGADHFFSGRLPLLRNLVTTHVNHRA